tara:strand:+ start:1002 stop:1247 length:246 start_codon:yes stop_codon:yes gene_type:complete
MKRSNTKKPYQYLAWLSTFSVLIGALLASLAPSYYFHHYFFIFGNTLLALTAFLWREYSLLVLNCGLSLIYIIGIVANYII